MTTFGPAYAAPALAPSSAALRGEVAAGRSVPKRALPGEPIRLAPQTWMPVPDARSRPRRGALSRAVRLLGALVLCALVLGIPAAATGVAAIALKPANRVSTQKVPGSIPPPQARPVGLVSAR